MLIDRWGCAHIVRKSPDWCRAMQHSIRPGQMRRVAGYLRRQVRPWASIGSADVAARWLRQQFEAGVLNTDDDRPIKPAHDTVCPPYATWERAVGDCDDYTAMMTSLTREMGWHADFVAGQVFVDGEWHGHAWTEGQDELGPFLLEPTVGPARVIRYRPNTYHREMILAPERCLLLH